MGNVPHAKRDVAGRISERMRGDVDELRGEVDATNGVAAPRKFERVPTGPTASIEDLRARQDAAVDQPRGDHSTFLTNGSIDEEVERPCVFGVERATPDLAHWDVVFIGQRLRITSGAPRSGWRRLVQLGQVLDLRSAHNTHQDGETKAG